MIAVEQRLGKTVSVVGRAHLVPELLESLAMGLRDLRVHGVEKRQGSQQVLTRSALPAGVITDGSTGATGRFVERQRVQPSEQVTHDGDLAALGHGLALDEPGDEDRAPLEVGHRVLDCETFRGVVVPLQESQDRGVTLGTGPRTGGVERTRDPRVAVVAVDAEDVGGVHAELRRRSRVDAVPAPQMREQAVGGGFVVHARTESLEVGQGFGVALPGLPGVAPDDLLEAGVLGHGNKPPLNTFVPQRRGVGEWLVVSTTERANSPSPMEPRLGRMLHSSATGRRRAGTFAEQPGIRQVLHPVPVEGEPGSRISDLRVRRCRR